MRAKIVAIMEWMQAQSAEMGLRRQHAKLEQDERGGRGAPCVRCGEGANARAHVARWRVYLDRCAATEQLSRAPRGDLEEDGTSCVHRCSHSKFALGFTNGSYEKKIHGPVFG